MLFSQAVGVVSRRAAHSSSACLLSSAPTEATAATGRTVRLTFLQSGSGESLAVEHGSGAFLFDCGEDTQRQFQRSALGKRGTFFHDIFLSHLHGERLWGLPLVLRDQVLRQLQQSPSSPQFPRLWGPYGLKAYVERAPWKSSEAEMSQVSLEIFESPTSPFYSASTKVPVDKAIAYQEKEALSQPFLTIGNSWKVYRAPLRHTVPTNGYVFHEDDYVDPTTDHKMRGRKIVLCGDSSNPSAIAPMAQDCDVLVFDAQLEQRLHRDAPHVRRSTPAMAAEFAQKINAKTLILTSLTQRTRENLEFNVTKPVTKFFSGQFLLAEDQFQFELPEQRLTE